MNFSITAEELAQYKHINFSVGLDSAGLSISTCPKEIVPAPCVQMPAGNLLTNLNHLSWGEVSNIGRSGAARQRIALGAVKTDHMKNGFNAEYRVIGFNHDDLADGSGKAPLSWEMTRVYKDERPMNSSGTNKGGWDESELRAWLNSDFFDLCSDELQSIIRPVVKLTSAGDRSGEIIKSIDRIFILSEKEVYGRVFYSVPGEGHWYEYYRLEDIPYFLLNEEGERVYRHLRSAYYYGYYYFCRVYTDGSAHSSFARAAGALAPGFCS